MTRRRISRSLRQRVLTAYRNQCAYCHTLTAITGARLVIDHIIPEAAGGQTVWENLCVACHSCNEFKGSQVAADDPLTGARVSLFHPRQQLWRQHFCWSEDGSHIIGLTPAGRATVVAPEPESPDHRRSTTPLDAGRLASSPRRRLTSPGNPSRFSNTPLFVLRLSGMVQQAHRTTRSA